MSEKSWVILAVVVVTAGVLLTIALTRSTPDSTRSDPKVVARDFLQAMADRSLERIASYIIAGEREAFEKDFNPEMMPNIPQIPEIRVKVKEVRGVKMAEVEVVNSKGLGFDMEFADGKWWIVK